MISLQYTENVTIPKELFSNGNISLRADLSFVIFMWSEGYSEPAYFFLDTDTFIKKFIFLFKLNAKSNFLLLQYLVHPL